MAADRNGRAALPAGALLSLALAPFLSDLVYGVGSRDVLSLVGALVLAAAAGLLGTIPMRKAANVNISGILRQL